MAVDEKTIPTEATTADAWKRDEEELVELPSGNTARLKRPQLSVMIRRGEIPNPLLEAAASMAVDVLPENLAEAVELTDVLVASAFVEPKIALVDAGPDELPIEALSDPDKGFVAHWIKDPVAAMSTFRGERAGAGGGEDGGALRDAA
jgi:hypothetical protein